MNRKATIVLAAILAIPFSVVAAYAGSIAVPDSLKDSRVPNKPWGGNFLLKAGGQIDLATSTVSFAGHGSKLGQFTATGTFDEFSSTVEGTMTDTRGLTMNFTLQFVLPLAGDHSVWLSFASAPGSSFVGGGEAGGQMLVDDDLIFSLDLDGFIQNF